MSTYIWSDLHLNHKNIIDYCGRPFESAEEMNKTMLKNWRETVKGNDTIINLGDVMLKGIDHAELTKTITNLPGKKMLVMGNHDRSRSVDFWRRAGFDEVYPYPIIYKEWFILSHEPVFVSKQIPYVNIHGHTHEKSYDHPSYVNVSVEMIDYKPVDLDVIMHKFTSQDTSELPEELK